MGHGWKLGENILGEIHELPDEGDPQLGRKDRRGEVPDKVRALIDSLHGEIHPGKK